MKNAALTDTKIKAARYGYSPVNPKTGKPLASLTDGRGLYLKLMPSGAHSWRFDFVSPESGKRQTLVIGSYPDVSLEQARKRAQDARNMLSEEPPRCPVGTKKARKEATKEAQETAKKVAKGEDVPGSLKAVALETLAMKWRAEPGDFVNTIQDDTAAAWAQRMEAHIFPKLGARPIATIQLEELVEALQAVPSKAVAFAMRGYLKDVFNRARKAKRIPANIALELDDELGKAPKNTPRPAQTTPGGFARVLRGIAEYPKVDHREVLQLAALLWQRPVNMTGMRWADLELSGDTDWFTRGTDGKALDLDYTGPVWVIPAADMKRDIEGKTNGKPHIVPLPAQAIEILKRRLAQRDPVEEFVFPSKGKDGGPLNYDVVTASLKSMGFQGVQSFHGFRASGASISGDVFKTHRDLTEMQLAHSNGLATGVSYQRGIRLEERAAMLQQFADYLDVLKAGNVTPIKRAA